MKQEFKVIITGEIFSEVDEKQALSLFAERFKISLEKAQSMLSKAPVAVKKGIEQAKAEKLGEAIKTIGLATRIEPMHSAGDGPTSDSQQSENQSEAQNKHQKSPEQASAQVILSGDSDSASVEDTSMEPSKTHQDTALNGVPESMPGYQFSYAGRPDYGFITVNIPANETLKVEASSMATMDTNIRMKTKMRGGLGRLVSGESMFINEFTAENGPGEIGIAPGTPGDVTHQYLDGQTLFLQNSAFVACTEGIEVETKWQGFTKGFFSGESFFLIRCSGKGDLWFNTYGAMVEVDIDGEYVVDTGNIVAFSEGLDYEITKVGGYKSLFFSGEGFVCRFSGQGKLWMQTRGTDAFVSWLQPFRRVEKSN